MKRFWFILVVQVLLTVSLTFPQAHKGRGKMGGVVSDKRGNPIEGVKVKLFSARAGSGFETLTNKKGEWKALWIAGGRWNIDFEKSGYEPKKINVEIREFQKVPDLEVELKKAEGMIVSDDLKAALEEGNRLYDEGKYDEAIGVFREMLQQYPDTYIIHMNLGNSFFQMEKYKEAVESYQKVLEYDTGNIDALVAVGNSYFNLGQIDVAMEWYNKIKIEEIKDATVLYNVGNSFYENSRQEEALRYYRRAVEIKKDFLEAKYQLGLTLIALEKQGEALKEFEEYLKYDSESSRASQVRGFIEYLKKK